MVLVGDGFERPFGAELQVPRKLWGYYPSPHMELLSMNTATDKDGIQAVQMASSCRQ